MFNLFKLIDKEEITRKKDSEGNIKFYSNVLKPNQYLRELNSKDFLKWNELIESNFRELPQSIQDSRQNDRELFLSNKMTSIGLFEDDKLIATLSILKTNVEELLFKVKQYYKLEEKYYNDVNSLLSKIDKEFRDVREITRFGSTANFNKKYFSIFLAFFRYMAGEATGNYVKSALVSITSRKHAAIYRSLFKKCLDVKNFPHVESYGFDPEKSERIEIILTAFPKFHEEGIDSRFIKRFSGAKEHKKENERTQPYSIIKETDTSLLLDNGFLIFLKDNKILVDTNREKNNDILLILNLSQITSYDNFLKENNEGDIKDFFSRLHMPLFQITFERNLLQNDLELYKILFSYCLLLYRKRYSGTFIFFSNINQFQFKTITNTNIFERDEKKEKYYLQVASIEDNVSSVKEIFNEKKIA